MMSVRAPARKTPRRKISRPRAARETATVGVIGEVTARAKRAAGPRRRVAGWLAGWLTGFPGRADAGLATATGWGAERPSHGLLLAVLKKLRKTHENDDSNFPKTVVKTVTG